MEQLTTWLVAFLLTLVPANFEHRGKYIPEAQETRAELEARYLEIAKDAIAVVYDPAEEPLYGKGTRAREASLMVLMAIAWMESGFRKDVDTGRGKFARGDFGRSWCLMQLNIDQGKTLEGWTGKELVEDRKKCFRAGYHAIRMSFNACRNLKPGDWLGAYAAGSCIENLSASRIRMQRAARWFALAPKIKDSEVMAGKGTVDTVLTIR